MTDKYVIISDPARDLEKIPFEKFYKRFTGALLILKPNNEFVRNKIKGGSMIMRFIKLLLPQKKLFIFSVITAIILTVLGIVSSLFNKIVMDIDMALVTGVILFNMNATLFGIIVFMTIISILLVFIFKQPYKKINEEQMQQSAVLNSQIIEGLRSFETIKGNANEQTELESIEKEYIKSLRISLKEGMLSNVQGSISELVSTVGNLVLMYFGIMQVIDNQTTLGSLMAFMTLSGYFMDPVGRLVGLQLQIQEANISMKRMTEILEYEREQDVYQTKDENSIEAMLMADEYLDHGKLYTEMKKVEGDIEIKNVTFRYGNCKPVLNNINFTIPKGHKVALVGASGSGKSTIAKLLLKYYEPEAGEIQMNGKDIKGYDNQSLRKAISYVPQSIELFSKSIYDNIRVSKMSVSLEEVKEAAKAADAHEFIRKLPMQYYTYLEEAGNGLSGGEKQRIALARAFFKKQSILYFG